MSASRPASAAELADEAVAGSTGERGADAQARAEFTSRTLVLDPRTHTLTLAGDVLLSTGRYHVRAERLTLSWTDELMLVGPATIAWCRCESPPALLRVQRLRASPEGSLELSHPVLELGGVPVLWAPWLRLEPPDRAGLLPLEVAWRGDDGAFIGTGVHLPLGAGGVSHLQLAGGAYSAGGFALSAAAASASSASWLRWEERSGTGLWLDLRGQAVADEGVGAAWSADAVRGRRGVQGTLELGRAARSSDRARFTLGGARGALVYGVSARADTRRGGAVSALDVVGPELGLGYGAPLGHLGTLELSLGASQLYTPAGSFSLARQRAALTLARPVGFYSLLTGVELEGAGRLGQAGWYGADASGRVRLGLPLARRSRPLGARRGASMHWLEPFIDASIGLVRTSGRPDLGYYAVVREGPLASAVVGLTTQHGSLARRRAARLTLRAGTALGEAQRWYPGVSWQAGADAELARVSSAGALTTRDRAWLSATRLELGAGDGLELEGHVEGRSSGDAPLAGFLDADRRRRLWTPWFATPGWSAGGELRVPVGQHWRAALGADVDLTGERWLARTASAEYRASCSCFSVTGSVQQRLGRGGIDAGLSIELAP